MSARSIFLCACLLASVAEAQQIFEYTEATAGSGFRVLGFPVPEPVASQTPVKGFRSYDSLHARNQALALESEDVRAVPVGESLLGETIWAYVLSSEHIATPEGLEKSAALVNGTIHAREWQSPEVVTGIIERFVERADDDYLHRYLLDHVRLVVIPVLNIDGFRQTQRYPRRIVAGLDPRVEEWPRDGRMRRKNLRGADQELESLDDHLAGVDLNRNQPPFFGTSPRGSPNPDDLTFRGLSPRSEPESEALLMAAELGPIGRLRWYEDVHSFSQVYFSDRTTNGRRNAIQSQLLSSYSRHHAAISRRAELAQGTVYQDVPGQPGEGIGATTEFFAEQLQIPSWTLEIEPQSGATDYGFLNPDGHSGFILPEAEISRVRSQLAESHVALGYFQAGLAHLQEVRILNEDGAVYEASWAVADASRRALRVSRDLGIVPGQRYTVWLRFNQPMRWLPGGAEIAAYPGHALPNIPAIRLDDVPVALEEGQWLAFAGAAPDGYARYRSDAFRAKLTVPELPAGDVRLSVTASDLLTRLADADPASPVDFAEGHWTGLNRSDGSESDLGGTDTTHVLQIVSAPEAKVSGSGAIALVEGQRASLSVAAELLPALNIEGLASSVELMETSDGVALLALENALPDGDRIGSLRGTASDVTLNIPIRVVDNDTDTLATFDYRSLDNIDFDAFRLAFEAATVQRSVLLQLPGSEIVLTALETAFAASGDVMIEGNGALVVCGSCGGFLATAGQLSIQEFSLQMDAAPGPVLSSGGEVTLQDVDLEGGGAGILVEAQRDVLVDRSFLAGGSAGIVSPEGEVVIRDSSLNDLERAVDARSVVVDHISLHDVSLGIAAMDALVATDSIFDGVAAPCEGPASGSGNTSTTIRCADSDRVVAGPLLGDPEPRGGFTRVLPLGVAADEVPAQRCERSDQRLGLRASAGCAAGAVEPTLLPHRGLWFNPARSGHGIDVHLIGRTMFVIWYTYQADGLPITYIAQGEYSDGFFTAPLLRFRRQPGAQESASESVGSVELRFSSADALVFDWDLSTIGQSSGTESMVPLVFGEGPGAFEASGAWAPPTELGYGFSFDAQDRTLVSLVYFYDATGELRWVIGDGVLDTASRVPLFSQLGFCPACERVEPSRFQVGELEVRFGAAGKGKADVRVGFPQSPFGGWNRRELGIVRLHPAERNRGL